MSGVSINIVRDGQVMPGYATRVDIAGKGPNDKVNRDVMWSLSFEPTIENISNFLLDPVKFIVDACFRLGVNSNWFIYGQPVTIQFNYFAESRKKSEKIDPHFFAQGMFGSNVVFVKCSFIERIDFEKIDPFLDLDRYIGELIGVGIYERFQPKINIVYNGAFKHYTVHYELIDTQEMPGDNLREDVVLNVTASFIKNPNIIPLCLNNCAKNSIFGFKSNGDRLESISRDLIFTIGSTVGDVLSGNGFSFTYQTAPLGIDSMVSTPNDESEDSDSVWAPMFSDCVTFVAGCNPEDPMAAAGILIAELESGCQLRWLPQSPPEPVTMIGTEVIISNGMQTSNEDPG